MTFDAVFEEAPGALARYDFAPGELIDLAEGLFLVDTATGAVEGWALTSQLEGTNERDGRYAVSSDNGWIEAVAPSQKETFVHDRLHGRTFRLLSVNARLISGIQGGKTVVEFHLPDTQPYVVGAAIADLEARTLTWIQLDPPDQNNGVGPATFSGDGSQLLVRMYPRQYLVATDTGKGRLLAVAEPDEPPPGVSPLASGAGYSLWLAGEDRPTAYDWAGNSVEDDALTPFRIASSAGAFAYEWDSPRAGGVAWTTLHTITLYRADGSPHLRLLGGHPAGAYGGGNVWLGDDSGLLVTTIEGLQLLTVEGDLRGGVALRRTVSGQPRHDGYRGSGGASQWRDPVRAEPRRFGLLDALEPGLGRHERVPALHPPGAVGRTLASRSRSLRPSCSSHRSMSRDCASRERTNASISATILRSPAPS